MRSPTGDPQRKSFARLTVSNRDGYTLRVEKLEHQFEDALKKLCDARVAQLYEEFGKTDVYVFVNMT